MKNLFTLSSSDHGQGRVAIGWNQDGNFLATCGVNRVVHIWGRDGKKVSEFDLGSGRCDSLDWDAEGERLAVRQASSGIVTIWSLVTRTATPFDTGFACGSSNSSEKISFLKWSRVGPELAIGSTKGNLVLYNSVSRRKVPLLGIHSKSIVCGAWSLSNRLCIGSADKSFSLLDSSGDRVMERTLSAAPHDVAFSPSIKRDGTEHREGTISINVGGKSILLFDLDDADKAPETLAFNKKYGSVVCYESYGASYMIVGFAKGQVSVTSTHPSELGDEIFTAKLFRTKLSDLSFSPALQRAAVCGDYSIKIVEKHADGWQVATSDEHAVDESIDGAVDSVEWTNDGNILACSTAGGAVYAFVGAMPSITAAHHTRVAFLSSLREITVVETHSRSGSGASPSHEVVAKLANEPSMVAVGPAHVAAAAHSTVYFYEVNDRDATACGKREYPGLIEGLSISAEHAACVCSGRLHLGVIPGSGAAKMRGSAAGAASKLASPVAAARHGRSHDADDLEMEQGHSIVLPLPSEGSNGSVVTTEITTTGAFAVYATSSGLIAMWSLTDWSPLTNAYYHHECGVRVLAPGPTGTRVAFLDDLGRGFVLSPSDGVAVPIAGLSPHVTSLMWDLQDWNVHANYVLIANSGDALEAYTYSPMTWNGPLVSKVGSIDLDSLQMDGESTPIESGYTPILCNNGRVVYVTNAPRLVLRL
jgi:WD repeat-containing protein 19